MRVRPGKLSHFPKPAWSALLHQVFPILGGLPLRIVNDPGPILAAVQRGRDDAGYFAQGIFSCLDPGIYQSLLRVQLTSKHINKRYDVAFFSDGYHSMSPRQNLIPDKNATNMPFADIWNSGFCYPRPVASFDN